MTAKWLSIIGIGEDGLDGLTLAARAIVDNAEVFFGGARHLSMVPQDGRERLAWPSPICTLLPEIENDVAVAFACSRQAIRCTTASARRSCAASIWTKLRSSPAARPLRWPRHGSAGRATRSSV